jgi:hypothetical protein
MILEFSIGLNLNWNIVQTIFIIMYEQEVYLNI